MRVLRLAFLAAFALAWISHGADAEDEHCTVPDTPGIIFLPKTSPPKNLLPLNEPGKDTPRDCEFYRWAWHTFLYVTQPDKAGRPEFLNYPTFEDVFKKKQSPLFAEQRPATLSLAPRVLFYPNKAPSSAPSEFSDFQQATVSAILVDQNNHAVFYALHLNKEFRQFILDYNLNTVDGLKTAPSDLEIRPGSVELKSAWLIVDDPNSFRNYFQTRATVSIFKTLENGKIVPDGTKTREVTVALLAIHVVGIIEGHPEFIWATFEHVQFKNDKDRNGVRDNAPASVSNPDQLPVMVSRETKKYQLYPSGELGAAAPADNANQPIRTPALKLDTKNQTFSPSTPIYRAYPSSQASDPSSTPPTPGEDPEIVDLNQNVRDLFVKKHLDKNDKRANYQLVGAVWLNTPRGLPSKNIPADFVEGLAFSNAVKRDPPVLAGEDRLSSTAMESFTQLENDPHGNSFPNCFSCHDTQAVAGLNASRLNVSHLFSKFFTAAGQH